MMKLKQVVAAAVALGALQAAQAALTLTTDGIDAGFSLSTFVGGYGAGNYGPLSQGILANGKVITGSVRDQKIYVFDDVDGQTLGSAVSSTSYSCQTGNCNWAMATVGGQVYGAQLFGGTFSRFNSDGSFSAIASLQNLGLSGYLGMWGNATNGTLVATSNRGLVEIDPLAGSFRVINAGAFGDGVTVSPDGKIAYVADGNIEAYDIASGALLNSFNGQGRGPDGTGVITGGKYNGFIVVNNNDGTLGLIDPTKGTEVIIANGGSRGDFVSADISNGTLFVSQYEQVARLSCGDGCSIGTAPVPEPATWALMGLGLAGLSLSRRRRTQAQAQAV